MSQEYILYDPRSSANHVFIQAEEYDQLVNARTKPQLFLYMEEKLNFVIENYIELEKRLLMFQ